MVAFRPCYPAGREKLSPPQYYAAGMAQPVLLSYAHIFRSPDMRGFLLWTAALIAMTLQGCTTTHPQHDNAGLGVGTGATVTNASAARKFASALNLDAYKQQVAQQIYDSSQQSFTGQLPPLLKSVVVLDITLDEQGKIVKLLMRRSNGFKNLERIAMDSVKRAGALPVPSSAVLGRHHNLNYMETWLFRADGKFQIRSLAEPQAGAEAIVVAKQGR